jgi:hypothetical protein
MSDLKPFSLAQHFEAPKNYLGCFGWLCGYSADADFLNDAAERFTRQTRSQRAYEGNIALAVMLDEGTPQISSTDASGVLHLPINILDARPFKLLHAKVAVLGFRHESDKKQWQLRLIVSTGNWTRETLEESLDLAWRIDLDSSDLKSLNDEVSLACADIVAAWEMLAWLRQHFDARLLDADLPEGRGKSLSSQARDRFEKWINQLEKAMPKKARPLPRFFDNRNTSLLDQLPALVVATGKNTARNYLAMGSGFYESSTEGSAPPKVLQKIVAKLKGEKNAPRLLTATTGIDVFVNPRACQAVAQSLQAMRGEKWAVRAAYQPGYFGPNSVRSLHAKFIFSANCRENSPLCLAAWLYLGSGNLTGPGFANKMSENGGNLEAGVVFAPGTLYWGGDKGIDSKQVLSNLLPIQRDSEIEEAAELSEGADMPERETAYRAAPVACLFWHDNEDRQDGRLEYPADDSSVDFTVLDESGQACAKAAEGGFIWRGKQPRQVKIRWYENGQNWESLVPVLDKYGRVAATALPQVDLEEAWWQLAGFPMPAEIDDEGEERDGEQNGGSRKAANNGKEARYPVRQMMQLIENLAAKQTALSQADWPAWCVRLEQSLVQAAETQAIKEFTKLELNPLSPLWHAPFRPSFAETPETPEGQAYETVLARVEREWKTDNLNRLGDL